MTPLLAGHTASASCSFVSVARKDISTRSARPLGSSYPTQTEAGGMHTIPLVVYVVLFVEGTQRGQVLVCTKSAQVNTFI